MSDAISIFDRMRYTPMRDVLRGRLTARLDVNGRLAASRLPEAVTNLIRRVVKRTRLWRLEKAEVADELIHHFADGIDDGRTAEELIASFGDADRAAKLIRRGKRRNRPLAWHAMILMRRLLLAVAALYLLLGLHFFSARPAPSVNYVALLDQKIATIPTDQRAWPMYREVIRRTNLQPFHASGHTPMPREVRKARPAQPEWPALVQWLTEHADALELARQASRKPSLGIPVGRGGAWDDPVLHPPGLDHGKYTLRRDGALTPLLDAPQGHFVALWFLADALAGDAYLARQQKDIDRLLRDLEAINRLADQLREHDVIPTAGHIPLVFRELALTAALDAVAAGADAFEPAQLQRMAHLFAGPATAADLISFERERRMIHDVVQHMYSDDGNGNGRLTPQGVRLLARLRETALTPEAVRDASWLFSDPAGVRDSFRSAAGPVLPMVVASRRELLGAADRITDLAEANLARPLWQADWAPFRRQFEEWRQSPSSRLKYAPLLGFFPSVETQAVAERYLGRRDGLSIAIALELHRRRHDGRYADSLDVLAPALLPSVPADRVNGQPLRYRLVNGQPLVYSVGSDTDDDGGRVPSRADGRPAPYLAMPSVSLRQKPDGDWILWPPTE